MTNRNNDQKTNPEKEKPGSSFTLFDLYRKKRLKQFENIIEQIDTAKLREHNF